MRDRKQVGQGKAGRRESRAEMPTNASHRRVRDLALAGGSWVLAVSLWGWAFGFGEVAALQNGSASGGGGALGLRLALAWGFLALLGLLLMGSERGRLFLFERRHPWLGVFSALLLLGLAWLGRTAGKALFGDPWGNLGPLLSSLFHTGTGSLGSWGTLPLLAVAEEVYWRGFLQRVLVRQIGPVSGLFLGAGFYALAALWLGLPMALAAYIVGLVWGWIFLIERSLIPVMISHALWSVLVFLALLNT